jgi:lipoate---protein ligase
MPNALKPRLPWRLMPPLQATGAQHMAIDRWLWNQLQQGHPPTLRFYTWAPAAISLGYHQSRYPAAWHDLHWQGQPLDLVRRPTGGRAVLHQGDLTYMVVASLDDLSYAMDDLAAPVTRQTSYAAICEFLIQGWRALGLDLQFGQWSPTVREASPQENRRSSARNYTHQANCFATATSADLVLPDGTKLVGSAQLRSGEAILQHGSMRLDPDRHLFNQVFGPGTLPESSGQMHQTLLGCDPAPIITTLTAAAQQCFRAQFQVQPLSHAEWLAIKALVEL